MQTKTPAEQHFMGEDCEQKKKYVSLKLTIQDQRK